jgi:hypothetical protein
VIFVRDGFAVEVRTKNLSRARNGRVCHECKIEIVRKGTPMLDDWRGGFKEIDEVGREEMRDEREQG